MTEFTTATIERSVLATLYFKNDLFFDHEIKADYFPNYWNEADGMIRAIQDGKKWISDQLMEWAGYVAINDFQENLEWLKSDFLKRLGVQLSEEIKFKLSEDDCEPFSLFAGAMDRLQKNSGLESFKSLPDFFPELDKFMDSEHKYEGITTGLKDLDRVTYGWESGTQIILAARPGMGKTALALHFAWSAAKAGKNVLFFPMEMTEISLVKRLISMDARIPGEAMKGTMSGETIGRIANWKEKYANMDNFHIMVPSDFENMMQICRKFSYRKQLDMVVVDYLQLFDIRMTGSRNDRLTEMSRQLKVLATKTGCITIVLSQLSREVEKMGNKRPALHHLRDSGAIEQDADMVLMLYRDSYYNDDPGGGLMEILMRKFRNGQPTNTFAEWIPECVAFNDANNIPESFPDEEIPF